MMILRIVVVVYTVVVTGALMVAISMIEDMKKGRR